jgi:hypothetical protein
MVETDPALRKDPRMALSRSPEPHRAALPAVLAALPGMLEHGFFGPELVDHILDAHGDEIERRELR